MLTKRFLKKKPKFLTSYINRIENSFLQELFIYRPLVIEKMFNKNLNSIKKSNLLNPSLNWKNYYDKKGKFNNKYDFVKKLFNVLQNNFIGIVDYNGELCIYNLNGIIKNIINYSSKSSVNSFSYDILEFSDMIHNIGNISIFVDEVLYAFVFSIEEGRELTKMHEPKYYDLSTGEAISIDKDDLYREFDYIT